MYDFPTNPTQGDVFTAGAAKWTWNGYAWIGGPAASTGGSGGGTPFPEAPIDGQQYGRQSAAWSVIVIPAGDWASITGKPATYPGDWNTTINKPAEFPSSWTLVTGKPSTYPSDWNTTANKPTSMTPTAHTHDFATGVTGKPGTYPPTLPIDYTSGISGKPATFPPDLPIGWNSISGKPATYPPTVPIAQADVANLTTDMANKVNRSGDTMTGDLYIDKVAPSLGLDKTAAGQQAALFGYSAHSPRWSVVLGDTLAEAGSNAGSLFRIERYSDGGAYLGSAVRWWRADAYCVLYGDTEVWKDNPYLKINKKASGQANVIAGMTNDSLRWTIVPGGNGLESGSNNGSDFSISRYSDAAAFLNTPMLISRATGVVNFDAAPTVKQTFPLVPMYIGDAAPGSPVDGMLWWRSTDGVMFLRFNDGTSTQWVEA